jgi:hypothetical protein
MAVGDCPECDSPWGYHPIMCDACGDPPVRRLRRSANTMNGAGGKSPACACAPTARPGRRAACPWRSRSASADSPATARPGGRSDSRTPGRSCPGYASADLS